MAKEKLKDYNQRQLKISERESPPLHDTPINKLLPQSKHNWTTEVHVRALVRLVPLFFIAVLRRADTAMGNQYALACIRLNLT